MSNNMPTSSESFLFALHDLARTIRLYADQKASRFGMTRAQWAVLAKVERTEGLKQTELAELLDIQPITATRLIDRLCDNGLIERRADTEDRRAKRLYLTPAAAPVLKQLHVLRSEITDSALQGFSSEDISRLAQQLESIRDNVRSAMATDQEENKARRQA
jgi:DNA-binding MarR family transcriptional regulator